MTSSNAAPTDEGRAAAVTTTTAASPPPAASTSASPRPRSRGDGGEDASVMAPSAPSTKLTLNSDTHITIKPLASLANDAGTVDQHSSSADLSDQPRPDQLSNEISNTDLPIPSPPTVSPLSTPAATNINVDENLSDDAVTKLTVDLPPLSLNRDSSIFRSGIFGPPQPANQRTSSAPEGMHLDDPFMLDRTGYNRSSQVQAIATTDPDPHGADYSSHGLLSGMRLSQGSIDPNAYIMNLAAQATLFRDQGPSVIAPSAVSLHSLTQDSDALTGSVEPTSASGSQKLESFAKIEFADSTFQMTTYAVIIGRDKQAMEQARADERREAAYRRKCEENERNGLPPPTPIMYDRGKFSKSYVSEEGGMLGPEHSDGEDVKPVKRRRPSSAAQSAAGEDNASGNHVQSNRQYVSHTTGAAAVDLGVLQPSPEHIPFIGIHSPGPDIASKTRGISRQHLKIQFNKKRGVFEGIALHKNGFFCEDVLYGLDQPATLRSGDRLQIKDVEFFFVINGVQIGMSGGEDEDVSSSKRMSVGGKEMSLDFEHSDHENFRDTSEDLSDVENIPTPVIESEHDDEEPERAPTPVSAALLASVAEPGPGLGLDLDLDLEPEATGAQPVAEEEHLSHEMIKPELDMLGELPPEFAMPDIPKRRGPGRPPKDGIMSKRERRLLKKQMQETSKKTLPQDPQEEKIKRPVGRPRKNPLPDESDRPEKRKYNKKKREDGEEGSDIEKRIKEKKDKKVRPKSPPLDLRIEDYTAEQLQKPTKNYGVLIDEALTNGPPDGLTLKQIYKRITARYPWFFFRSETKGWESSVRHNLIGNEAFKKDEETGLWSRVPGVELDAGKKRKANSPDRHLGASHLHSHLSHPPYYQSSPYANPGSVTYAHGLHYSTEQKHPQPSYTATGQTTQLQTTTSQAPSQPVYTAHVPAPAQLPPGYGSLALSRPSNTPQQSTYSSPYARPPPPSNPPAKVETNQASSQTPAASSTTQSATPAQQQQQSRPSIASAGSREQLSPEIERAIMQFSANMLNVISKQTPHAANIIEAAANRVRGLPVQNRIPGFDSVETTLINAMQGMIRDMKQKHSHTASASPAPSAPAQTSSTPSPAPTNTAEAEIQRRLRNFRESMVTALRTKTDKAEIIVDSAINRARGLPHAGKIPGWEEADNLMVKSVTQIIAEARSAHSLKLQNASPTPANTNRTAGSQPAQSANRAEPSAPQAAIQTPIACAAPPAPTSNGMPTSTSTYTSNAHAVSGAPNSTSSSIVRPGMSLQRPAPVALTRPPTGSMARPPVFHKDSAPAPAAMSTTTPAVPRPNVSSPAAPSAGVLDQITGHKRFTDDALYKSHIANSNISTSSNAGGNAATSCNNTNHPGASIAGSSSVTNATPPSTVASSTPSVTAINTASNMASKAPGNTASNTVNNTLGAPVANLTNNVPINTPGNSISSHTVSTPISNAPTNMASHSTSSATDNKLSSTPSNQTGSVSAIDDVNVTKSSTASNVSGATPRITTSHITNSVSDNVNNRGTTPKATITDIANNPAATSSNTSTTEGALGATPNLKPGHNQGDNTITNTSVATGAGVSHATGTHQPGL
ncbi:hypothetical protein EKO27_g9006 [Xylaria grammica]|uniref:Fork-head domain-containing protein n=1 Tax=Xylaria grammica TaxID=363999 RepID=A0A439CVE6_9PEZI|nr:hypothetical protein EKO27_g9006 [Xylaria grammica]